MSNYIVEEALRSFCCHRHHLQSHQQQQRSCRHAPIRTRDTTITIPHPLYPLQIQSENMSVETAEKEKDADIKKENKKDEEMNDGDASTEKKEEKPKKKKHTDWPLKDIKEPHEHDVLYGRGGGKKQ